MAATLTYSQCRVVTDEGVDTNDNPDITLGTGNATGDRAYFMVSTSANADAQPSTPSGWSVANAVVSTGTTLRTTVFMKDLTSADDSTNHVATIGAGSRRWTAAVFVVRDWTGTPTITTASSNVSSTLVGVPDVTPAANNMLRVVCGAYRINGTASGVTITTTFDGFAQVDAAYSTQATASRYGCYIASKQLVGQSGVDQTDGNFTTSTAAATKWSFGITFEPAPVGAATVFRRMDASRGLTVR